MHARRLLLSTLALLAAIASAAAIAAPEVSGRRIAIGEADAQRFLEGRFPHRQDALGGLVEVTASNPLLAIPPGDRMHLAVDLAVSTAGGGPVPLGTLALTSALRYDTAQGAFFLDQPRIDDFRQAGGGAGLSAASREVLNSWLADYARSQPVYRIEPELAALLGDLQVQSAGVENGRLVVTFNQDIGFLAPALAP
ncbi:DUF1439 domain-containing protein [Pseudoxanthomonas suwonensis]|uniref:DUF1439 domain-containing protein n=1 Tax=Pseudoxanthomonas suwonensis TaxID=314722 RepID=A0A0E3UP12_9GAMM|nr:DUF1439 domain-containing protein [Pseudoxanthomonas suwonensis]AKC87646.1 hypothetical protein WQ53_13655 [Pseudoxanthomonas suwonensis]